MNVAFIISMDRQKELSADQLLNEIFELEGRRAKMIMNYIDAPLFRNKLRNVTLWICLIKNELEERAVKQPMETIDDFLNCETLKVE